MDVNFQIPPQPNLAHLLSTNQPPSAMDSVHITMWEKSFDDTLAEIDTAVSSLSQTQASLHASRDIYRPCLSALRRFPLEILQEIFSWTQNTSLIDIFNPNEYIWIIGQVSRNWRNALHGCPRLWSRTLKVDAGAAGNRRSPLDMLSLVLSRTGAVDIGFVLIDGPLAEDILPLLVDRHAQWSFASFQRMTEATLAKLPVDHRMPRLGEAHLDLARSFPYSPPPLRVFEHAPLLSTISLHRIGFVDLLLSGEQLTSVKMHHSYAAIDSARRGMDVIEACPNLRSLETDPGQAYSLTSVTSYISHTLLTKLVTCDVGLLQCLTLPNLEFLALIATSSRTSTFTGLVQGLPAVKEFLQRSNPPIRVLHLDNCQLPSLLIEDVLRRAPHLSELAFAYTTAPDRVTRLGLISLIEKMRNDDGLLARLERFVLHDFTEVDNVSFIGDNFVEMVENRRKILRYVDVKICCPRHRDVKRRPFGCLHRCRVEDLWELREKGMDVRIVEMDTNWDFVSGYEQVSC